MESGEEKKIVSFWRKVVSIYKRKHTHLDVLPVVPKLTKGGQPGANSCPAKGFVPGQIINTGDIQDYISVFQHATHRLPSSPVS